MPGLPVIADCFRVTINWQELNGVTPRNVLHVSSTSSNVDDIADSFDLAVKNSLPSHNPWECMSSSRVAPTFDILPLDGTSVSSTHTFTETPVGIGGGQEVYQAAAVVSLQTARRGPRGRGRQFIGPCCEDTINSGHNGDVSGMQDGWDFLLDQLVIQDPILQLVVASYKHADMNVVTAARVDSILGTMRRRQNQIR
jgi:hypothetical protein